MDSLTQIVLGASMGEVVGGKKLGNRAMLWGAIAGTIPDLDVFSVLFGASPIQSLAFHRGISHSILFAFLAPLLLAAYTHWYYKDPDRYNNPTKKKIVAILGVIFLVFSAVVLNVIPYVFNGRVSFLMLLTTLGLVLYFSRKLFVDYVPAVEKVNNLSYRNWYILFFISTITHPLLDCCTGYGTQIYQPFSDVRIAWHNISVADPIYTLGFLTFLLLAAFTPRHLMRRRYFNYIGIGFSMLYMLWTVNNKLHVNEVFETTLEESSIEYQRYLTTPTILNNILWNCVAETDSMFYTGNYSLNDENKFVHLNAIAKNHHLIKFPEDESYKTLQWFSSDYYALMPVNDTTVQFNDMRYGVFLGGNSNKLKDYMFNFRLTERPDNTYSFEQTRTRAIGNRRDVMMQTMWNRIMGRM